MKSYIKVICAVGFTAALAATTAFSQNLLISAREATDLEEVGVGDGRFGQGECWGGD